MTLKLLRTAGIAIAIGIAAMANAQQLESYFDCKDQSASRFRPFYMQAIDNGTAYRDYSQTSRGLLGQNAMTSFDECERAVEQANTEFGVICSRTGLDGWKPTLYTGTTPGRADFGYMGGSSIMRFQDCLLATAKSSSQGVCFWGGSSWFVSPIDHEGISQGPFGSIEQCTQATQM